MVQPKSIVLKPPPQKKLLNATKFYKQNNWKKITSSYNWNANTLDIYVKEPLV